MYDAIVQIVAPHYCYGCGKTGYILCDNCKYNIVNDAYEQCIMCFALSYDGVCRNCKNVVPFTKAWCVAEREGVLEKIIDDYKFMRIRAAYKTLAQLLDETLPVLPVDTVVVPIPTASSHIRQRGYDHCRLIAKEFARLRGLYCDTTLLRRLHNKRQRGKNKEERLRLAESAFQLQRNPDNSRTHLIIDDIITTVSTVTAAANLIRQEDSMPVYAAAIARQTLDD